LDGAEGSWTFPEKKKSFLKKKKFFEKSFLKKKIEKNGEQIFCCLENQFRPRPQVSGLEGVELLEGDQRQQVEML
jgi:hypothetical protein